MAGPGDLEREAQAVHPAPGGLLADDHAPAVAVVSGELRAGPEPAVGRGMPQGVPQVDLLVGGQLWPAAVGGLAAVGQSIGPLGVPASEDRADPAGGEADSLGDPLGARRVGPGQAPEDLPMGLLESRSVGPIAAGDLVVGQAQSDRQSGSGYGGILRAWVAPNDNVSDPGDSV